MSKADHLAENDKVQARIDELSAMYDRADPEDALGVYEGFAVYIASILDDEQWRKAVMIGNITCSASKTFRLGLTDDDERAASILAEYLKNKGE